MTKINITGAKKVENPSAAYIAQCAATGVDPYEHREVCIDTAQVTPQAALEAIALSQNPPVAQPQSAVAPIGITQVGDEQVIAAAVLVEQGKKIDQIIAKRGLESDDEDDHSGEEDANEQCKKKKCKCEHTQEKKKTSEAEKRKTLQDATTELAGGVPGAAVIPNGTTAVAGQTTIQPILQQIQKKLDKIIDQEGVDDVDDVEEDAKADDGEDVEEEVVEEVQQVKE